MKTEKYIKVTCDAKLLNQPAEQLLATGRPRVKVVTIAWTRCSPILT